MKKLKQYTSPAVRFETLRLQENIADKCWGWASSNGAGDVDSMYYDTKGPGYVHFSVSGDNCKQGGGLNVRIEECPDVADVTAAKDEFYAWWNSDEVQRKCSSYQGSGYSETPPTWS